jgi:hypothetical protein
MAVSTLFLGMAITQEILVLHPPGTVSLVRSWLVLLLPPMTFIPILITLIADFAVRASIGGGDDVESVKTNGSFWL